MRNAELIKQLLLLRAYVYDNLLIVSRSNSFDVWIRSILIDSSTEALVSLPKAGRSIEPNYPHSLLAFWWQSEVIGLQRSDTETPLRALLSDFS